MSAIKRVQLEEALPVGQRTFTFNVSIDPDKCTGCGVCAIECPSRIIEMTPRQLKNNTPYCAKDCLAENDVRSAMYSLRNGGSYEEAWEIITATNPLPACVGRVCPHPCEDACSRKHLDEPLNLHDFERTIGDYGIQHKLLHKKSGDRKNERIAVVGGGPSGISCAYQLAKMGYPVTIYEAMEKLGGMLRYGVPEYRVAKDILDAEIEAVLALGIEAKCGVRVGEDILLNNLKSEYNAIYLALGSTKEMALNVEGEEAAIPGLAYLRAEAEGKPIKPGKNVVVIGGGNVAMDCARTALRGGAGKVRVVSLESLYEMPAWESEIREAQKEGIELLPGWGVKSISGKKAVLKKCTKVYDEDGGFNPIYDDTDTTEIPFDTLITAVGQRPDTHSLARDGGVQTLRGGAIHIADECECRTMVVGVYAGGDVTHHSNQGTVAGCIAMGNRAAKQIASDLLNEEPANDAIPLPVSNKIDQIKYNTPISRKDELMDEIDRCLVCATALAEYVGAQDARQFNMACNNCHNCVSVCKEKAISFQYTTCGINTDFSFNE